MSDRNFIICVCLLLAFLTGLTLGLPPYKISKELQNKIYQDAKNNYRSFDEQIGFIISKYYDKVVQFD